MIHDTEHKRGLCSICGARYGGYGFTALPVTDGKCCSDCYAIKVVPARLEPYGIKPIRIGGHREGSHHK